MNGTFMQHLGRNQNLGDVRAKLEVQGRWLALAALPVGIGIFRYVSTAFGADDGGGGSGVAGNILRYCATIGKGGRGLALRSSSKKWNFHSCSLLPVLLFKLNVILCVCACE